MTDSLHRLVYVSHNFIPGDETQVKDEIKQILEASQRNNAKVGVTGALMFNSGCFTQILEGGRDAVSTVFERIQRDERHSDVVVLEFGEAQERDFAQWSMGFVGSDGEPLECLKEIVASTNFDEAAMTHRDIYQSIYEIMKDEDPVIL